MSDGGGGTSDGGPSYGHGGGFWQSPNAFSGLTNTDLRPRKKRRRPVPLLNTSWVAARRRKGANMRKDFDGLVGGLFSTLEKSMLEIAASGSADSDALMKRSIGEFRATLGERLDPILISDTTDEEMAKGLNHVALFAGALRDVGRTVEAIKTGKPSWMSESSSGTTEIVTPEIEESLDHFLHVGVLSLQQMVNATAMEISDDDDLARAEQIGELHKIECEYGDDILVKTALPPAYREFLTDPVELMTSYAETGRYFFNQAASIADPLIKADAVPVEFADEFPELFEKAAGDEDIGAGGDPDATPDPGDDPGATDDTPSDPIEMITRLASIIVVVAGSLQQAGQGDQDATTGGDPSGMPDDTSAANPLQRRAPGLAIRREQVAANSAGAGDFGDVTLEKIFNGSVEVDESVANELMAGRALRKAHQDQADALAKTNAQLKIMQEAVARLQSQPVAPKGPLFQVSKSEDNRMVPQAQATAQADREQRIAELAKTDPERASRELMKVVHSGGGTPLVPPSN